MRPASLSLVLLLLSSCTLSSGWSECDTDSGCPVTGGKKLYCTSDHLCVVGTPTERLCTLTYPASPPPGAVHIGVLLRLPAGGSGVSDLLRLQAIELGVDEVNGLSGSGQRSLVAHVCDVSANEEDALKAMKKVIHEQGAVAIVGPSSSQSVIDVSAEAGASQVPLVAPSATAAAITNLSQKGFIFRVAPSDNQQGPVLANQVNQAPKGVNLALIFVNDTYGQGLQSSFTTAWFALDPANKPALTFSFTAGDSQRLSTIPTEVVAKNPNYVLAIASADAATVLSQLVTLPTSVPILMTDGAKKSTLLNLLKTLPASHFNRVKGTAPTVSTGGAYVTFRNAFTGKFMGADPGGDAFAAYTYDAFYAIAIAIGSIHDPPTGPLVAAALQRISGTKTQLTVGSSGYLDAVSKLAANPGATLNGASGAIRFTKDGDRDTGLFELWSIDVNAGTFVSMPL